MTTETTEPATGTATQPSGPGWTAVATLALVALADHLILTTVPGVGWFIAAAATAAVIGGGALGRARLVHGLTAIGIGALAALPLVEAPSLPGVVMALAGLAIAALLVAGWLPRSIDAMPGLMLRFAALAPLRLAADLVASLSGRAERGIGRALWRQLAGWVVPLVFVAVFLWLFVAANPVFDLLAAWFVPGSLAFPQPARIVCWVILAGGAWALLRPRLLPARERKAAMAGPTNESVLFGKAAILRSLVIFNVIFALQTLSDVAYLWGGVALPDGLTYADYAHRGAMPLIATTLLAAGFVLAAMRRDGPGMHSVAIRRLVYVWIAQNILLCISSILRLDLYVEAYSLTELRVASGIWMGLVAVGLLLILLRIALRRSNAWLIATNLASLGVTLYGCAWIDFSAVIARFNVEHSREISGRGVSLDLAYLHGLGHTVIPALDHYIAHVLAKGGPAGRATELRSDLDWRFRYGEQRDWRAWSWRDQRLADYLDSTAGNDDNQSVVPQ